MSQEFKTLYVEPTEEITAIIDRLKKTTEQEVVIVIPRGATVLQSVINLKLLKKNAEKAEKFNIWGGNNAKYNIEPQEENYHPDNVHPTE